MQITGLPETRGVTLWQTGFREKRRFEEMFKTTKAALLTFRGVESFDVYNCSIPFRWEGKRYILAGSKSGKNGYESIAAWQAQTVGSTR
jgi:hypothetical protein